MIRKIQSLSNSFRKIGFFHVLRKLNGKADHAANIAPTLGKGLLVKNDSSTFFPNRIGPGLMVLRARDMLLPRGARC